MDKYLGQYLEHLREGIKKYGQSKLIIRRNNMKKIITLTRKIETLTIKYGNATGICDKEYNRQLLQVTREELNHEIRKSQRA